MVLGNTHHSVSTDHYLWLIEVSTDSHTHNNRQHQKKGRKKNGMANEFKGYEMFTKYFNNKYNIK